MLSSQRAVGIVVMALSLCGCGDSGDGFPREPVSGTVTFDGGPLGNGMIQFQPDGTREGVASGGMISEGRFEVAREVGPPPGRYRVLIFALSGSQASGDRPIGSAEGASTTPGRSRGKAEVGRGKRDIPPRYNVRTELVADVKAGGPNSYTFTLKK